MPSRRRLLRAGAAGLATALAGCEALQPTESGQQTDDDTPTGTPTPGSVEKVDDWQLDPKAFVSDRGGGGGHGTGTPMATGAPAPQAAGGGGASYAANAQTTSKVGLAAGGAKDVNNFRENVEQGYLPLPTDVSYEGLFYDYYFDTGASRPCTETFCPAYSTAVSPDPLSGSGTRPEGEVPDERAASETSRERGEPYLTVGLDSGLSQSAFERKDLNLVVVLDVSGSMGERFSNYYYDGGGTPSPESEARTKIEIARKAVADMTTHLREDDRFGMVVFNDGSTVAKPMRRVGETDMDAIRDHIGEIRAGGGTRFSGGVDDATELLSPYANADQTERETRMVVITDAMPNLGDTSEGGLLDRLEENAAKDIHTTMVGVGVDFNTRLVDAITAVKGANYYSVHSAEEFEQRLAEEFEYMVTPLVYDLSLELESDAYDIAKVYGSTAAEEATGELLHVNTLFPSPSKGGKAKGGVVLVQLRRTGPGETATLTAEWTTRAGRQRQTERTVRIPSGEHYDNTGIRKAILLARYADLLKSWTVHERTDDPPHPEAGVGLPPEVDDDRLGRWERQSHDLTVSPVYRERFDRFADHFDAEMQAVGDDTLQRELDLLRRLATHDGKSSEKTPDTPGPHDADGGGRLTTPEPLSGGPSSPRT